VFTYRHIKKEYEGCDTITFKVLGISVLAFVLSSAKSPCLLYKNMEHDEEKKKGHVVIRMDTMRFHSIPTGTVDDVQQNSR
jgi:hypothetical protein